MKWWQRIHTWPESARSLAGLSVVLLAALLPHAPHLPFWMPLIYVACASWRLWLEIHGAGLPPKWLRIVVALAALIVVAMRARNLSGLEAGTALLSMMAGIKLLESRELRDYTVSIFIALFLVFAELLYQQTLWMLPYLLGCVWLCTAALMRLHAGTLMPQRLALQRTGSMLLQAIPLMILLFILVPRLPGQFWVLPARGSATTGLSDSMSPGDVTQLYQTDDVAFRVQFADATPSSTQLYWRTMVLHDFDGRTWRRRGPISNSTQVIAGKSYRYRMLLEPTNQPWIPALDAPLQINAGGTLRRSLMSNDLQIMSILPITQLTAIEMTSSTEYQLDLTLNDTLRRIDTALPGTLNPRSRALASQLRSSVSDDLDYLNLLLKRFREQAFYYTLEPPALGVNTVDDFLFVTQRGFCEHFASALTFMMRAANIPARVVTGYQGGEYNALSNYWVVRQSDAHAWSEVWLPQRGWVRVDPTSAVAPSRIDRTAAETIARNNQRADELAANLPTSLLNWQQRWDALNTFWKERVVNFDSSEQQSLLNKIGLGNADWQKLGLLLLSSFVVFFVGMLSWLTWRYRTTPLSPEVQAWHTLQRILAQHGITHQPHEGPIDYLHRAAQALPAWAEKLARIRDAYVALRYQPQPSKQQLALLQQLIKSLNR